MKLTDYLKNLIGNSDDDLSIQVYDKSKNKGSSFVIPGGSNIEVVDVGLQKNGKRKNKSVSGPAKSDENPFVFVFIAVGIRVLTLDILKRYEVNKVWINHTTQLLFTSENA